MKRRNRRQRVVMRGRHREQVKHLVRRVLWRSAFFALALGFALGMYVQGGPVFGQFLKDHTPVVDVMAPQALSGAPVVKDFPAQRFWLWFPGVGVSLERRLQRKYPALRALRMERRYWANRIVIHLDPRVPLALWDNSGMDRDGFLFPVTPNVVLTLPKVHILSALPRKDLGRWLDELSHDTAIWTQLAAVSDDRQGYLALDLKTGTRVLWGPPVPLNLPQKAGFLTRILNDAHEHLGGASTADLRFFDEGRIIVKPKSLRS